VPNVTHPTLPLENVRAAKYVSQIANFVYSWKAGT
jgi:hypothetical protein